MAQLALIKTATNKYQANDIAGIFETTHKFSEYEKAQFNFILISDIERSELIALLTAEMPERKRVWKSVTTSWTDKPPVKTDVWKDGEKWRRVVNGFTKYTLREMDKADKDVLSSLQTTKSEKETVIRKIKNVCYLNADNQEEIKGIV